MSVHRFILGLKRSLKNGFEKLMPYILFYNILQYYLQRYNPLSILFPLLSPFKLQENPNMLREPGY